MLYYDHWLARELKSKRVREVECRSEAFHRLCRATLLRQTISSRRRTLLHQMSLRTLYRLGNTLVALGERLQRYSLLHMHTFEVSQGIAERRDISRILPAAQGFLDSFAEFLLEAGILATFEEFPDGQERRTTPSFFFCHTLHIAQCFK